jgi:methylmalonyl-CoA/ethylmalonyl-CoA epimerase
MRQAEIEQNLQLEQARLSQVEARLRFLEQDVNRLKYDVVARDIAPLLVASIRRKVSDADREIEQMFDEVEEYAGKYQARSANSPLTIYHDDEYLEKAADVEVAVPITHLIPASEGIAIREIPGVPTAACLIYAGGYERADEALNTLMIWIESNGYRSNGPLREVYLRFGANSAESLDIPDAFLADQRELYVTEIQLPVEKVPETTGRRLIMDASPQMQGLKQIGQIFIAARNLKRAVDFYRDTLGMKFLFDITNAAFFECDGVRLMLALPEKPEMDHPASIIYYRVKDIHKEYELLLSRGVKFEGEPHLIARMDDYDLWMCFLKDSEGNTLGLMSEAPHE